MLTTFFILNPFLTYVLVGIFSLIIGSFLNVVIYRLPRVLEEEYTRNCQTLLNLPTQATQSINLCFPRSFCPNCTHFIRAWQNIPLISYLWLRGRCKQCQHRISWHYPLVEAFCMGLSLFSLFHFGLNLTFFFVLLFIWLMIPLCFIDLQHQILPDSLTLSLLWMGLIANTLSLFTTLPNAVLSTAGAYLFLWAFVKLFYVVTKKNGMGHGDFKLFAAFGAWFGWTQLPLILLMSSLIGAVVGISFLKITGKSHQTPIPFGPFLGFSGLVALFYGPSINHWYLMSFQ
jgi:leader peptidase (prepilin peptidase)/N-methyltransferase